MGGSELHASVTSAAVRSFHFVLVAAAAAPLPGGRHGRRLLQLRVSALAGQRVSGQKSRNGSRSNTRRRGDLQDNDQRRDLVTAFGVAEVGCAYLTALCQCLLREPSFLQRARSLRAEKASFRALTSRLGCREFVSDVLGRCLTDPTNAVEPDVPSVGLESSPGECSYIL